jgi:hypothetical protein
MEKTPVKPEAKQEKKEEKPVEKKEEELSEREIVSILEGEEELS